MGQRETEQREADELLVQAQRMDAIGRLAPGLAHDLNNSLAAIVAFGQLLRTDDRLPAEVRRDADLLLAEAERTRRLTQALLDLLRQRPPERHPTKLPALVASVLELQSYALSSAGIAVVVDIPAALPPVPLDREALQQVLLNLIQDAIGVRSALHPRRITITAGETDLDGAPAARLEIADDVPQGQPDAADRLAWRVSAAIVAAHGGALTDVPNPEGAGRVRAVTLPLRPQESEPADAPVRPPDLAAADRRTGHAVLVIDDEPAIREFVNRVLSRAGYRPVLAGDGAEAVDRVRTTAVAAVLCDYRLPTMSGSEVYEALVATRPELRGRFAFMTGDTLDPDFVEFVRRHDLATLTKPFDIEALRAVVDEIVRNGREARDQSRG